MQSAKSNSTTKPILLDQVIYNAWLPTIPGQLAELALDLADIVGVDLEDEVALEGTAAIWLARGLATTGLGPLALLRDLMGEGGLGAKPPPIQRQMQSEGQCGLVC